METKKARTSIDNSSFIFFNEKKNVKNHHHHNLRISSTLSFYRTNFLDFFITHKNYRSVFSYLSGQGMNGIINHDRGVVLNNNVREMTTNEKFVIEREDFDKIIRMGRGMESAAQKKKLFKLLNRGKKTKEINKFANSFNIKTQKKSKEEIIHTMIEKYFNRNSFEERRMIEMENLKKVKWNEIYLFFGNRVIPVEVVSYILDFMEINVQLLDGIGSVNMNFYLVVNKLFGNRLRKFKINSKRIKKIPIIVMKNIQVLILGKLVKAEINYLLDTINVNSAKEINLVNFSKMRSLEYFFLMIKQKNLVFQNVTKIKFPLIEKNGVLEINLKNSFPNLKGVYFRSCPPVMDYCGLKIIELQVPLNKLKIMKEILSSNENNQINFGLLKKLVLTDITITDEVQKNSNKISLEEKNVLSDLLRKCQNLREFKAKVFFFRDSRKIIDKFFKTLEKKEFENFHINCSHHYEANGIEKLENYQNLDWLLTNISHKITLEGFSPRFYLELISKFLNGCQNLKKKRIEFITSGRFPDSEKEIVMILEKIMEFNHLKDLPDYLSFSFEMNYKFEQWTNIKSKVSLISRGKIEICIEYQMSEFGFYFTKNKRVEEMGFLQFLRKFKFLSRNIHVLSLKVTKTTEKFFKGVDPFFSNFLQEVKSKWKEQSIHVDVKTDEINKKNVKLNTNELTFNFQEK